MADESPQPTPRPVARTAKRAAPSAGSTASSTAGSTAATPRRRPPARPAPPVSDAASLADSPFIDPLLQPVVDGTPVEIPVIVPSWIDEEDAPLSPTPMPRSDDLRSADEQPTRALLVTDSAPAPLEAARGVRAPKQMRVPRGRRPRVRRVTRVVRQVDTWSVFKVALVFSLFLYAVCLTAGVLLWQVAQNTGTVDNVERFFESFGWQSFQLKGGVLFHNAWVGGLFLVVGLTGLCVLVATMFNLIAELVGGIRVTVLEEEVIAREERGLGWRRGNRSTTADTEADQAQA